MGAAGQGPKPSHLNLSSRLRRPDRLAPSDSVAMPARSRRLSKPAGALVAPMGAGKTESHRRCRRAAAGLRQNACSESRTAAALSSTGRAGWLPWERRPVPVLICGQQGLPFALIRWWLGSA